MDSSLFQMAGIVGVAASTASAFTNLTISILTSSALLLPSISRPKAPLNEREGTQSSWDLARQWAEFEALGHKVSMAALVTSTSSLLYAGLKCSESATSKKGLFFLSVGFNILTIPYTLVFMLRKNSELESRSCTGQKKDLADIDTPALMQNVSFLGKFRGSLPLLGAIAGALALLV